MEILIVLGVLLLGIILGIVASVVFAQWYAKRKAKEMQATMEELFPGIDVAGLVGKLEQGKII